MNKQSKPPSPLAQPRLTEADKDLIRSFQAYLHMVMMAEQTGQTGQVTGLPGSKMLGYCRALAKLPGNTLAAELQKAVHGQSLNQIWDAEVAFAEPIRQKKVKDQAAREELEVILEQLDFALARIFRDVLWWAKFRAQTTRSLDLLVDVTYAVLGSGEEAAGLIRRLQKLCPDDYPIINGAAEEGSFPDRFAWEAYERVEVLDKLADEFPELVRTAGRHMDAWPMLCHRHAKNRRRFNQLAQGLELGADYPFDVSEGARFRPDTRLVRFIGARLHRLHNLWRDVEGCEHKTVQDEKRVLANLWWHWPEENPGDEILEILRAVRHLPPLTKKTAHDWAKTGLVPLILATDARDWTNCSEPVLRNIAEQKGVKSRATFKSRLLAAVSSCLQRLSREG